MKTKGLCPHHRISYNTANEGAQLLDQAPVDVLEHILLCGEGLEEPLRYAIARIVGDKTLPAAKRSKTPPFTEEDRRRHYLNTCRRLGVTIPEGFSHETD